MPQKILPAKYPAFPALALTVLSVTFALLFRFLQPAGVILFEFSESGEYAVPERMAELIDETANNYLSQTASLLGERYDEDFYETAVQENLEHLAEIPLPVFNESGLDRSEWTALFNAENIEDDTAFLDFLVFLDDVQADETASKPILAGYEAGNPVNAFGDAMITQNIGTRPSRISVSEISRLSRRALPIAESCALLFSLFSVIVSLFTPESPADALFGAGASFIRKFLDTLQERCLKRTGRSRNLQNKAVSAFHRRFFLSGPHTSERKCTVLIL